MKPDLIIKMRSVCLACCATALLVPWRAAAYPFALATRENITLTGNGIATDSYDSTDPNFSTNGQYDPAKASTNGHVASKSGVVDIGDRTIGGNLVLGPTATFVSSMQQVSGRICSGGSFDFPEVVEPSNVSWISTPNGVDHFFNSQNTNYYLINDTKSIYVFPGANAILKVTTATWSPPNIKTFGA